MNAAASAAAQGQTGLEAQAGLTGVHGEPGGDVQQPVSQPLRLGLGEVAAEEQVWVQTIRLCAIRTSSSQTSFSA